MMFKKSYLREGGIRTCFPCILENKNTDKATLTNTKLWTDTEVTMQRSVITRHHPESVKPKVRFGHMTAIILSEWQNVLLLVAAD